jgi:hypothetical protein
MNIIPMNRDYKNIRGFKPLMYSFFFLIIFLWYILVELTPFYYIYFNLSKAYSMLVTYYSGKIKNRKQAEAHYRFLQMCEASKDKIDFWLKMAVIVTKKVLKRSGYYQEYEAINPEIYLTLEGKKYEELTREARMEFDKEYEYFIDSIKNHGWKEN